MNYLAECGLCIDDYPYLNTKDAFFNNKRDYIDTCGLSDSNITLLLTVFESNLERLYQMFLSNMKPIGNQIIKHVKNTDTQTRRKYGCTVEACVINALIKRLKQLNNGNNDNSGSNSNSNSNNSESDQKTGETSKYKIHYNKASIKFDFFEIETVKSFSNTLNKLNYTSQKKTELSVVCDDEHILSLLWNRETKLLCIYECHYKTIV